MTSTVTTRKSPWKKIALTGAVLIGAGALVGAGAFAVFTASGTATNAVDAGQLDILVTGTATVSDIAPGDIVQRPIGISLPTTTNDGDLVASVRLQTGITADTVGTSDASTGVGSGQSLVSGAQGLDYSYDVCVNGTWSTTTAPAGVYTCSGTVTNLGTGKLNTLSTVPLNLTPAAFGVTPTTTGTFPTDAGTVTLNTLMTLTLPTAADNNYENASATITYTASAIQRAGIQK